MVWAASETGVGEGLTERLRQRTGQSREIPYVPSGRADMGTARRASGRIVGTRVVRCSVTYSSSPTKFP